MIGTCIECGRSGHRVRLGVCDGCYSRARRSDPEVAEHDRAVSRAWKKRNRERHASYDREYASRPDVRGFCTRCGGQMGAAKRKGIDGVCQSCRSELAAERAELIIRRWGQGLSLRDIAAELGSTPGSVGVDIARLRGAGRDLPHRRPRRVAA